MIKIYTTPTCGHCKNAKDYFMSEGIDFQEIQVVSRAIADEMFSISGVMSVPLIQVGDKHMLGWSVEEFKKLYGGGTETTDGGKV